MTGETIEQVMLTLAVNEERSMALLQTESGAQQHQCWMDKRQLQGVIDTLIQLELMVADRQAVLQ